MNIGINGFGRIGRMFLRAAVLRKDPERRLNIQVVSDIHCDTEQFCYQLRRDSVYGAFPGEIVKAGRDGIMVNGRLIRCVQATEFLYGLPWKELGTELVLEATGQYTDFKRASGHLSAGAKKVIITAQASGKGKTVIPGVNENRYDSRDEVLSAGSCTTNCIAPVCRVLIDEGYGIEDVYTTTVHSYTASQKLMDGYTSDDLRTGRASGMNIIPFQTKSPEAVADVLPELKGKLKGVAYRVPVTGGALVDLTVITTRPATIGEVDRSFQKAAAGYLKGILDYSEEELVSCDIVGNPASAVYDSRMTNRVNRHLAERPGNIFKLTVWYDNEWGYANRLVDLAERIALGEKKMASAAALIYSGLGV